MDFYNSSAGMKMESMDTGLQKLQAQYMEQQNEMVCYVRYGQPQDHVTAHFGAVSPAPQFRHTVQYPGRSSKPNVNFDERTSFVAVPYEDEVHYPSKVEVHYPTKIRRQPSPEYNDPGNKFASQSDDYSAPKGSWQYSSFKEAQDSRTFNDGQMTGSVNGNMGMGRLGMAQKTNYGVKSAQRGFNQQSEYQSVQQKSMNYKSPNMTSKVTHPTVQYKDGRPYMKNEFQHSFTKPGYTHNKYQMSDSTRAAALNGQQQKYPWKFTADGAIRKRKKPTMAQKNMKLKKSVQPKNAVMCLHDLVPNIVFTLEQEGDGCKVNAVMSVEVKGEKFRGYGHNKQIAKQASAEAALVSFVKPTTSDKEDEENGTPWSTLASFAMYKLFNEWREGRYGGSPTPVQGQNAMVSHTLQTILNRSGKVVSAPKEAPQPMKVSTSQKKAKMQIDNGNSKATPNPAKQVPANSASIHPVMLLHQMRPELVFSQSQSGVMANGSQGFIVSCVIDGRQYNGEGVNVKKAKYDLALKANQAVYGVHSTFVEKK